MDDEAVRERRYLACTNRVHSTKVKPKGWYPTKAEAIPAFERTCKHLDIAPPARYLPTVSGDSITGQQPSYS